MKRDYKYSKSTSRDVLPVVSTTSQSFHNVPKEHHLLGTKLEPGEHSHSSHNRRYTFLCLNHHSFQNFFLLIITLCYSWVYIIGDWCVCVFTCVCGYSLVESRCQLLFSSSITLFFYFYFFFGSLTELTTQPQGCISLHLPAPGL